jgi:DNA-binding CsgD family transcriptional regulator
MQHRWADRKLPWNRVWDFFVHISASRDLDDFFTSLHTNIGTLIPYDHSVQWFRIQNSDGKGFYDAFRTGHPRFECLADSTGNTEVVDNFNSYYWRRQPAPERLEKHGYSVDWKAWNDTEYYTDFIRPAGIRHSLVPVKKELRYTFTLQRGMSGPAFSDEEAKLIGIVAVHLDNIYSCLQKIDGLERTLTADIDLERLGYRFTPREAEILRLLLVRFSSAESAAYLCISRRTVEKHIADVYEKLNIRSRQELFLLYRQRIT